MENKQKEIRAWLSGPRDYTEGADLYEKYGYNLRLRQVFNHKPKSATTEALMLEELRKLAGVSAGELATMKRTAKQAATATATEAKTESKAEAQPATGTGAKMVRFRQQYPFLSSPDCPDVLKVLVADMFTAFGEYKDAHLRLAKLPDDAPAAEAAAECEKVVEAFLADREIKAELDHYAKTGQILGKSAKFREAEKSVELAAIPDIELVSKIRSARVQESKAKKKGSDELLASWREKREAYEAELERRKKN